MADVLVWVMHRRVVLAARAEQLREELAGIDAAVARLEAAEVVVAAASEPVPAKDVSVQLGRATRPGQGGAGTQQAPAPGGPGLAAPHPRRPFHRPAAAARLTGHGPDFGVTREPTTGVEGFRAKEDRPRRGHRTARGPVGRCRTRTGGRGPLVRDRTKGSRRLKA